MADSKKENWEKRIKGGTVDAALALEAPYSAHYVEILANVLNDLHIYDENEIAVITAQLQGEHHNWCEATLNVPLQDPEQVVEDFLTDTITAFMKERVRTRVAKAIQQ